MVNAGEGAGERDWSGKASAAIVDEDEVRPRAHPPPLCLCSAYPSITSWIVSCMHEHVIFHRSQAFLRALLHDGCSRHCVKAIATASPSRRPHSSAAHAFAAGRKESMNDEVVCRTTTPRPLQRASTGDQRQYSSLRARLGNKRPETPPMTMRSCEGRGAPQRDAACVALSGMRHVARKQRLSSLCRRVRLAPDTIDCQRGSSAQLRLMNVDCRYR